MGKKDGVGKTARLVLFALAATLATSASGASVGNVAASATGASVGNVAASASASAENVAALPDPGDDWILRKRENAAPLETAGKDGAKNDSNAENAGKTERFAALDDVAAVGKIVAIDSAGIETEDWRRDRRERTPKRPGDAILFLPPVDPSAAEAFCVEIREARGAWNRDRFWLRNGDEFDGELLKVDRRRVWIRAFDVEFAVPRGRVRAVRFAETVDDKKEERGEK